MKTAIVITLDHEHLGPESASRIWAGIEQGLLAAGFIKNNRLFLSSLNPEQAFAAAREVTDALEAQLAGQGISLYAALQEFYGMDYLSTENLLVPSSASIIVSGSAL